MSERFVAIWFPHLTTNWLALRQPALRDVPFVAAAPVHGRMMITEAASAAEKQGIVTGMPVADAKAILPGLEVLHDRPGRSARLLKALGEWCVRYTPIVAPDPPDGLILDSSGCSHLWGGESAYLKEVINRLAAGGYEARAAMADTIGAAWAIARFGQNGQVIERDEQASALLSLPPAALRLQPPILERLQKLGLSRISHFMNMPRAALRRRFGEELLTRLRQALGLEDEPVQPLELLIPYRERLPCLEPVCTAAGIEIAIERLLEALCQRLEREGKGLRTAILKCYRVDGRVLQATIGTSRPANRPGHLLELFRLKIASLQPDLGIELFVLEAQKVEDVPAAQDALWRGRSDMTGQQLAELLDRLAGKIGTNAIHRYLPAEHYWPERSVKPASALSEKSAIDWRTDRPRPLRLLSRPEPVEVSAPIPDYPPMLFRYKGKTHPVRKADGPERIECEWWLEEGVHRDYYQVEDEQGQRYWLFRSGHYTGSPSRQWFLHGFFA